MTKEKLMRMIEAYADEVANMAVNDHISPDWWYAQLSCESIATRRAEIEEALEALCTTTE